MLAAESGGKADKPSAYTVSSSCSTSLNWSLESLVTISSAMGYTQLARTSVASKRINGTFHLIDHVAWTLEVASTMARPGNMYLPCLSLAVLVLWSGCKSCYR